MTSNTKQIEANTTQSQNKQVLSWLKSGESLTSFQAFSYWGIQRLSARIQDLEKLGYVINAPLEFDGSRHWSKYSMDKVI